MPKSSRQLRLAASTSASPDPPTDLQDQDFAARIPFLYHYRLLNPLFLRNPPTAQPSSPVMVLPGCVFFAWAGGAGGKGDWRGRLLKLGVRASLRGLYLWAMQFGRRLGSRSLPSCHTFAATLEPFFALRVWREGKEADSGIGGLCRGVQVVDAFFACFVLPSRGPGGAVYIVGAWLNGFCFYSCWLRLLCDVCA